MHNKNAIKFKILFFAVLALSEYQTLKIALYAHHKADASICVFFCAHAEYILSTYIYRYS